MRPLTFLIGIAVGLGATTSVAPAADTPSVGGSTAATRGLASVVPGSGKFLVARVPVDRRVPLRARPAGRWIATAGPWTRFGSRVVLSVVEQRGEWLAVLSPAVGNGRVAWVRASRVRVSRTNVSLRIDLSKRRLVRIEGSRVVRRMTVGIGKPESPTPTGRFAVTDKLPGSWLGPYYGCCIVALTAKQPNLPRGWSGGNRIGIHGTNDPASIGAASSAGCPRATAADMRVLMRRVPLGAPVFIHP